MRIKTYVLGKVAEPFDSSAIYQPRTPDRRGVRVAAHDLRTGTLSVGVYITHEQFIIIGRTKGWLQDGTVVL